LEQAGGRFEWSAYEHSVTREQRWVGYSDLYEDELAVRQSGHKMDTSANANLITRSLKHY